MKKIIRLTESDLTRIVKRVIRESADDGEIDMEKLPEEIKDFVFRYGNVSSNATDEEIIAEMNDMSISTDSRFKFDEKKLAKRLTVGVRQLRQDASGVLKLVKAGQRVVVTEHGRAIARLVPISNPSLQDYIDAGVVTAAVRKYNSKIDKPMQMPKGVDLVAELLRERAES